MSGVNTSTAVLGDILLKYSELHLFRDLFRYWEVGREVCKTMVRICEDV